MKHNPESRPVTTGRVVIIDGDATNAEMLHTFFRLMELDPVIVEPDERAAATASRLAPAVVIVDLDLAVPPPLEIARQIRRLAPVTRIVLITSGTFLATEFPLTRKPRNLFEDFLELMEVVLG
jgi:ActR/RegA family two-component response regulator